MSSLYFKLVKRLLKFKISVSSDVCNVNMAIRVKCPKYVKHSSFWLIFLDFWDLWRPFNTQYLTLWSLLIFLREIGGKWYATSYVYSKDQEIHAGGQIFTPWDAAFISRFSFRPVTHPFLATNSWEDPILIRKV